MVDPGMRGTATQQHAAMPQTGGIQKKNALILNYSRYLND